MADGLPAAGVRDTPLALRTIATASTPASAHPAQERPERFPLLVAIALFALGTDRRRAADAPIRGGQPATDVARPTRSSHCRVRYPP